MLGRMLDLQEQPFPMLQQFIDGVDTGVGQFSPGYWPGSGW